MTVHWWAYGQSFPPSGQRVLFCYRARDGERTVIAYRDADLELRCRWVDDSRQRYSDADLVRWTEIPEPDRITRSTDELSIGERVVLTPSGQLGSVVAVERATYYVTTYVVGDHQGKQGRYLLDQLAVDIGCHACGARPGVACVQSIPHSRNLSGPKL